MTASNRTGTLSSHGEAAPRRPPIAHLSVALQAADPQAPPTRHRLSGVNAVTLGRGEARDVQRTQRALSLALPDHWLSSEHLRLRPVLHRWAVEDTGSRNGTFVNGA